MNRLSALAAIPVFLIIILTLPAQQSEPPEMAFFFQSDSPNDDLAQGRSPRLARAGRMATLPSPST